MTALEDQGDRSSISGLGKLWKKIKNALKNVWDDLKKDFQKFMKKYFRFSVLWVKFELVSPPTAKVRTSVEISDLDFYVQVKIEACIKLGKWKCGDITSPRIHLASSKFFYDLTIVNNEIFGKPRAGDMKLIIDVKIFGFSFRITVGITSFVNKILDKQKPAKLFSLKDFEIKIDAFKRKIVPDSLALVNGKNYIEVDLDGEFVAIP